MNNKEFENKYAELIPHAPVEEILSLFKEKKKFYTSSKLTLVYQKIKDKIKKSKTAHFLELGYEDFKSFDLFKDMFDLALKNERADMIEYFFENNFIAPYLFNFELAKLVVSEKVLSKILKNEKLEKQFSSDDYYAMLDKAVMKNLTKIIDLIFETNPEKIKQIPKDLQEKLIIHSIYFNSDEVFFKLLNMKEPLQFDIHLKQDDFNGIDDKRDNLLITAAKNNNIEIMRYLLTSPELIEHVDLTESIHWIRNLKNGDEIIDKIVFDIKAPLTERLENLLKEPTKNHRIENLNSELLDKFKKRDFMLKLEEKLEPRGNKVKTHKI